MRTLSVPVMVPRVRLRLLDLQLRQPLAPLLQPPGLLRLVPRPQLQPVLNEQQLKLPVLMVMLTAELTLA